MKRRKVACVACKREHAEVGPISRSGLCRECSLQRQYDNAEQIANRQGPYYEAYLRGLKNYAEWKLEKATR